MHVNKESESKKVHQPDTSSSHLDSLDDVKQQVTNKSDSSSTSLDKIGDGGMKRQVADKSDSHNAEMLTLFGVTGLASFLVIKYVL